MKTSELTGAALDWAVAVCEHNVGWAPEGQDRDYYSTDWAQGGPIIEREGISVREVLTGFWAAEVEAGAYEHEGPTPLIAAMRCYVASRRGNDIEIPEELK
jgi:hypothetical protein